MAKFYTKALFIHFIFTLKALLVHTCHYLRIIFIFNRMFPIFNSLYRKRLFEHDLLIIVSLGNFLIIIAIIFIFSMGNKILYL